MNKLIKSQDGQQIYFMPPNVPCLFNIATIAKNEDGTEKASPDFSVGINSISFGLFKKPERATDVLKQLETFLLNKSAQYQVPADK